MSYVRRTYGKDENVNRILVGKLEGYRPLVRPSRRWEDNIRTDLRETKREVLDRVYLAQNRDRWRVIVNKVINFRVP
jgi:hypothetical protein